MLTIKLSRIGKKKTPIYRIIISEKARDPYGKALEILGTYNPFTKEIIAKNDRINYWISKGAQMTPTVNNLLVGKKIVKGDKVTASKAKKKKKNGEEKTSPTDSADSSPEKKPEGNVSADKTTEPKTEEKKESTEKTSEKPVEEKKNKNN